LTDLDQSAFASDKEHKEALDIIFNSITTELHGILQSFGQVMAIIEALRAIANMCSYGQRQTTPKCFKL
jgi:hypothetical protein